MLHPAFNTLFLKPDSKLEGKKMQQEEFESAVHLGHNHMAGRQGTWRVGYIWDQGGSLLIWYIWGGPPNGISLLKK